MEALIRKEARKLTHPGSMYFDDLCQEGRIAFWKEGPKAVRWRMVDYFRKITHHRAKNEVEILPLDAELREHDDIKVHDAVKSKEFGPCDVVCARDTWRRLPDEHKKALQAQNLKEIAEDRGITIPGACKYRSRIRSQIGSRNGKINRKWAI